MSPSGERSQSLVGARVCCLIQTDSPARNARLIKVAEAAAAAGAEIVVLYASATPPDSVALGPGVARRVALKGASTCRVWPIRVLANIARETLTNPLRIAAEAWRENATLYHAHFLPALLPALVAGGLRRAPVVYDVRDLYVDAARALWPAWKVRYFEWVERYCVRKAHAVLAISEPMARLMEQRYGLAEVQTILNGPYECSTVAIPSRLPVRLLFQGAFSYNRNLASLVRAMSRLRANATLTLQGWGDQEQELRELVDSLGLQDTVFFREPCAPLDVVGCARDYDVGVICYKADTPNLEIAAPNKLMDYIGAGLAVAASDLPGHRSVISKAGCGVLIDPSSHETIARDLDALVSDPERVTELKRAAVAACSSLSWAVQANRLIAVYRNALDSCASRCGA